MTDVIVVVQDGPYVVEQPQPAPLNTCIQGPPGTPGGGGAGDSFTTVETDSGTSPAAAGADTLRIVGGPGVQTVGNAAADEVQIEVTEVDGGFF